MTTRFRGDGLLEDEVTWVREKVILRNVKWEPSHVSLVDRAEKYNQRASLILITGPSGAPRKEVAKALEANLFDAGRLVYYLGIGSLKYGLDADLPDEKNTRDEHFRRLGELAHILIDTGLILVVTASEVAQYDLDIVKAIIDAGRLQVVWIGDSINTDAAIDLHLTDGSTHTYVTQIKQHLQELGVIYLPR